MTSAGVCPKRDATDPLPDLAPMKPVVKPLTRKLEEPDRRSFVWNGFTILHSHVRAEWQESMVSKPRGSTMAEMA